MATRIEDLAAKLGARIVGTVPEHSSGAFGVAQLAKIQRRRQERDWLRQEPRGEASGEKALKGLRTGPIQTAVWCAKPASE